MADVLQQNINITVTGEGAAATDSGTDTTPTEGVETPKTHNPQPSATKGVVGIAVAKQFGAQAKAIAMARVGQVTGDSNKQAIVGAASTIIGYGTTIAAGAASGGVPGAVIAAGMVSVNIGVNAWDFNFTKKRAEYTRANALERAGRSDRSR